MNLLDTENWIELVEVAVAGSQELQIELVKLLSDYLDDDMATKYAVRYAIPEERLPCHLTHLLKINLREK